MKQNFYMFYEEVKKLSLQNSEYENKSNELKEIISNFKESVKQIEIDDVVNKDENLKSLFDENLDKLKSFPSKMSEIFEELREKDKFRNELENYFITMVFGKVKAGKSSLGNFIIENRLDNQKVEIFIYDRAGKEKKIDRLEEIQEEKNKEKEKFDVKATECTTEIQGFKLGGMAWIDTPGLGSMTPENGELAKAYIKHADYIIYPTNSAAPMQRDEIEELKELFKENKKITICITKSDKFEEDECECGSEEGCEKCEEGIIKKLVNKSEDDREKQEEWVRGEVGKVLKELGKEDALLGDIISISVHVAKEGLKNSDEELFRNSNIEKFYDMMRVILEKKAQKLKEVTPYENLKALVDKFLEEDKEVSIKKLKEDMENIDKNITQKLNKFRELKENIEIDIFNIIENVASQKVINITKSNAQEIFAEIDEEVKNEVKEVVEKNIQEILEDFTVNLNSLTLSSDNLKIEDKYDTLKVRYDNSGVIRTVFHYATFGLVDKEYKTIREKIYLGDNKEEVIKSFKESRKREFNKFAKDSYERVENEFFKSLQNELKKINEKIDNFEGELKNFKSSLKV